MMFGCGGLAGLRYANFSVMPSVSKQLTKEPGSLLSRFWTSGLTSTLIPFGCFFASLTLIDQMVLYGVAPALLGFGILATCTFIQAKGL